MKSNRQARRLLGVTAWNCQRISNRRLLNILSGKQHVKPSRRQRKRNRRVAAIVAWAEGQHTQGGERRWPKLILKALRSKIALQASAEGWTIRRDRNTCFAPGHKIIKGKI